MSAPVRRIDVELDDRWFLPIPAEDREVWAEQCVVTLLSDDPERPRKETARSLLQLADMADPSAFASLLFCPDGLPGHALVAIYGAEAPFASLEDLPELAPAALPRQILPLRDHDPAVGRVISTLTQVPDVGVVGTLQYELLRDGVLLEVVVTSPRLESLGRGMPVFEELIERIVVHDPEDSHRVPA